MVGGWSGVLGSCDHGLLFMFTVISWGAVHLFDTCFGLVCGCA